MTVIDKNGKGIFNSDYYVIDIINNHIIVEKDNEIKIYDKISKSYLKESYINYQFGPIYNNKDCIALQRADNTWVILVWE